MNHAGVDEGRRSHRGEHRPLSSPSRVQLDRADTPDGGGDAGVGDQDCRVLNRRCVLRTGHGGDALKGSSGDPVRRMREARRRDHPDLEVGRLESLTVKLPRPPVGQGDHQVGGQRLEARDLNDLDPRLASGPFEVGDDLAHEGQLARQVHVMGSSLDAGFDDGPAVERVGADEVEYDAGARSHRPQRLGVPDVRRDRLGGTDPDLAQDPCQLGPIPGRSCPAQAARRSTFRQVSGHPPTRHAGCPEDHHIQVTTLHGLRPYR